MLNLPELNQRLLEAARGNDFSGHDPFDGLNSRFFNYLPSLKKGIFGLAWLQLHKRSPINLRDLCRVPHRRNPKGVALFILGLLQDYQRTGDFSYLNDAIRLADWLLTQQSDTENWKYPCWGYHFDWNARAFYVDKGKPNIITTVYVARALYALGLLTNKSVYMDVAFKTADFIVSRLYVENDSNQGFFAYIPGEQVLVHNANLWGAAWVGQVAQLTDNEAYKTLSIGAANCSLKHQHENGSWNYGTRHHHQFIDGFHTGYNLEALTILKETLATELFDDAIAQGFDFYKKSFFEENGTVKYYHNSRYPLDMHSVSQAIFTLLKVGSTEEDVELTKLAVEQATKTLYLPGKGRFAYQKTRYFINKVDYIRWTQAWVYYSFAFFNHFQSKQAAK